MADISSTIVRSVQGGGTITSYPDRAFDLTPSDVEEFTEAAVCVYVGSSGDVVVEPWRGDNTVTFSMSTGEFVPVAVRRVLSTGTTATGLIGVY